MAEDKREKRIKELLEEMEKERGYLPSPWPYLAHKDLDFMEAYNNLYNIALKAGKALPVKTKELIQIAILAYRGRDIAVEEHIKRAMLHGATKQEIFEAIQTTLINGGATAMGTGLRALMKIEEEEKKGNRNSRRR